MDIDKILLKVINNQASSEEYKALESWKNESAENIELLKQLSNQGVGETYKQYDKQTAWKKVNAQIDEPVKKRTARGSSKVWIWCIAGLLLLGGLALFINKNTSQTTPKKYNSNDVNLAFALEDKTEVWLREGGYTLDIVSDFQKERIVELSGEAFFDVAHNEKMPFYIELDNDDKIKVVGTSFNLMTVGDHLDLTIYEGVVELHSNDTVIVLTKGDRLTRINGAIVKYKNNNLNTLSWKNKELIFDNALITDVFKCIENHYKVNITYQGVKNNFSACLVRTKFTEDSLENVMQELSKLLDFKYKITNKEIAVIDLNC